MNTVDGMLYPGQVMHRRVQDHAYRFRYPVFSLLLDIDRLDEIDRRLRLLSCNRANLLSFHERDHGPGDGSALRPWLETRLRQAGIALEGGPVRLLCFPRLFGYVFNPLSVWYCHHRDGSLRAVLCEVSNTFGERHGYLLHEQGRPMAWPVRSTRDKCFHVSPFLPMGLEYRFRLGDPEEQLSIAIQCHDGDRLAMAAVQTGRPRPLTDRNLLRMLLRTPLLTFKVMAMIHWQALKLFVRRAPLFRKPTPPLEEISS